LSIDFQLPGFNGAVSLSVVDCSLGGYLLQPQDGESLVPFDLDNGHLSSHTSSVDGFVGVSRGSLHSEWSNEAGQKHVLEAEFSMRAAMADARAEQL
jgi:hypothetical protein